MFPIYRVKAKLNLVFGSLSGQIMNIPTGSVGTIQIVQANAPVNPNDGPSGHRSLVELKFNGTSMITTLSTDQNNPSLDWVFVPKPGGGGPAMFERVTIKNMTSVKDQNRESSYFGEQVVSGKENDLKDAFAVIGTLFFALIIYWYVTGGPFKTIQ